MFCTESKSEQNMVHWPQQFKSRHKREMWPCQFPPRYSQKEAAEGGDMGPIKQVNRMGSVRAFFPSEQPNEITHSLSCTKPIIGKLSFNTLRRSK